LAIFTHRQPARTPALRASRFFAMLLRAGRPVCSSGSHTRRRFRIFAAEGAAAGAAPSPSASSSGPGGKSAVRRLILLRHADSEISSNVRDYDRPISMQGMRQAASIAQKLQQLGWLPDLVLASNSKRTKQTLDHMAQLWKELGDVDSHYLGSLYTVSMQTRPQGTRLPSFPPLAEGLTRRPAHQPHHRRARQAARQPALSGPCAPGPITTQPPALDGRAHRPRSRRARPAHAQAPGFLPPPPQVAALDGQTRSHLEKCIQDIVGQSDVSTVMCVGHNKGWEEAATSWAQQAVRLRTASAALLQAAGPSWEDVLADEAQWQLVQVVTP
jgi:phosphohistidine phosphatase SixA